MNKFLIVMMFAGVASGSALGGTKVTGVVQVDTQNRHAFGSVGSARNSADSVQYIGCTVFSYSDGTASAWCGGRDANYGYGACTTSVPALVDQARNLKGDSYLNVYWDSNYACTSIEVRNHSYYEPKAQ